MRKPSAQGVGGTIRCREFTLNAKLVGTEGADARRVKFIASTMAVDAHGTRLHPRGCKLTRFQAAGQLPFLWAHKRDGEPDDVLGRVVDVQISDERVECVVEFDTHQKAQECLRKVRAGVIRACSVGFVALVEELAADGVIDVFEWELCELSLCPIGSNPEALAVRGFTLRNASAGSASAGCASAGNTPATAGAGTLQDRYGDARKRSATQTRRVDPMNAADILAKLGLQEGATPEQIVEALLKYMAAHASELIAYPAEAKALLMGLLSMLTPAPAAPAPSSSSASDGGASAAAEAMADEVKRLSARVAELEQKNAELEQKSREMEQKSRAPEAPKESPEQRADAAIKDGRWPLGQRDALITQYRDYDKAQAEHEKTKTGKAPRTPFLFAPKSFSSRNINFTAGGNPKPSAQTAPNLGDNDGADEHGLTASDHKSIAMLKRQGISVTPAEFAARKSAEQSK